MGSVAATAPKEQQRGYRLIGILQWGLPLMLSAVAITFEVTEHVVPSSFRQPVNLTFPGEVLLFGILGPLATAVAIAYIRHLLKVQMEARAALERLNQDLERIVCERTGHLEEARRALEAKNEALGRANTELRQMDDLKSEFVSLVSHALRAPLTNISGALELIAQDGEALPPHAQRTLGLLLHETERLRTLVKTILDISRLDAGKLKRKPGPLALGPLVRQAARAMVSGQPDRRLLVEIQAGLPPAWADDQHVEEIVSNLVSNAVKYSPRESPIHVTIFGSDNVLQVAVTDHGSGIRAEEQPALFEAFRRTPLGEHADPGGGGLGLYFARRLVEANGGRIWVESPIWSQRQGPGARFSFSLPAAGEVPSEALEPA